MLFRSLRQVTATLSEPMMLTAGTPALLLPELQAPAEGDRKDEERMLPREPKVRTPNSRDAIFDYVAESIRRDAAQSTRLIEAWIGPSGEAE